jgi:hypothetical protein
LFLGGKAYDAAVKRSGGTGSGAVIPRDGDLIKVFQLRLAPVVLFGSGGEATSPHDNATSQPGSGSEQSASIASFCWGEKVGRPHKPEI